MLRQGAGTGRVKVTRRVSSDPDHRGRRTLLARKGSILSVAEAVRRGIDLDALEPVGTGGKQALEVLRAAAADDDQGDPVAAAEEAARAADKAGQRDSEKRRANRARPDGDPNVTYPHHRGGPNWTLSDGSTFKGSRDAAEAAEAQLHEQPDAAGDDADDGSQPAGDEGAAGGGEGDDE